MPGTWKQKGVALPSGRSEVVEKKGRGRCLKCDWSIVIFSSLVAEEAQITSLGSFLGELNPVCNSAELPLHLHLKMFQVLPSRADLERCSVCVCVCVCGCATTRGAFQRGSVSVNYSLFYEFHFCLLFKSNPRHNKKEEKSAIKKFCLLFKIFLLSKKKTLSIFSLRCSSAFPV